MNDQQYIEHEVKIRVIQEVTDTKFTLMQKNIDDKFAHVDYKINIIIGIGVVAILIPLIKSALGVL